MLMKLAPKKRRNPRNFFIGVGATLVLMGVGKYFAHKAEQDKAASQARLVEQLQQLKSTLPRQVDPITTLEYVGFTYGDTLFYRYRVDLAVSSLSEARKADMQAQIRRGLEQLACNEPQLLKAMRNNKFHQEHYYLGRNSTTLFSIELYPEQLTCPG